MPYGLLNYSILYCIVNFLLGCNGFYVLYFLWSFMGEGGGRGSNYYILLLIMSIIIIVAGVDQIVALICVMFLSRYVSVSKICQIF